MIEVHTCWLSAGSGPHEDLARSWGRQGRHTETRDLLAPVHGWFSVGFDIMELQRSNALLDSLLVASRVKARWGSSSSPRQVEPRFLAHMRVFLRGLDPMDHAELVFLCWK
jgi:hypothetical protein